MPRIRHPHPGTDVVPYPLHTVTILPAGKDVKAHLRPVGQPLRNLKRLVQLMVGRVYAVDNILLALGGEVGMKLNHGALWLDGSRAIYLDLVVALSIHWPHPQERDEDHHNAKPITHIERASGNQHPYGSAGDSGRASARDRWR